MEEEKRVACDRCGAEPTPLDGTWRHIDGRLEHKCADLIGELSQAGHLGTCAVPEDGLPSALQGMPGTDLEVGR